MPTRLVPARHKRVEVCATSSSRTTPETRSLQLGVFEAEPYRKTKRRRHRFSITCRRLVFIGACEFERSLVEFRIRRRIDHFDARDLTFSVDVHQHGYVGLEALTGQRRGIPRLAFGLFSFGRN